MERPIKGGYILISLGLVALSAGASLTVDYERITKTKKHIVLTGIKVADTIMPDVTVKPIFGNGTITFSDVYGYDIVVSSNGSASVSETKNKVEGDFEVTGELKVGTLNQIQPNWESDLEITSYTSSINLTSSYAKILLIDKMLYIIINVKLTNNTESAVVTQSWNDIEVSLPKYISDKIYDETGVKVSENAPSGGAVIMSAPVQQVSGLSFIEIRHTGENRITITHSYNGFTIQPNSSINADLRTFLSLF